MAVTTSNGQTLIVAKNNGVAPIYYDACFSINGHCSDASLKGLLPRQQATYTIDFAGDEVLEIVESRLVSGQTIDFVNSF